MIKAKKVLILAPHTDDGELGCGGTISKMIREGSEIYYVAFSRCEDSLPDWAPRDMLVTELHAATTKLGIDQDKVEIKNYPVRRFSNHRQEILDDIIRLRTEINPDLVFMPALSDIHQDHSVIAIEGLRAFKKTSILSYELTWNNLNFSNQAFVVLSEQDVENKVQALAEYKTQTGRQYTSAENIVAVLKTHGIQIGVDYAEVFEVPRLVTF